jgi:uncharacterized protein YecE (DUF72 family)
MPFDRERIRQRAATLAQRGVFIGTSSWKYRGWCGSLYDPARYEWRGRFAESRFQKQCLAEYAEVFKTVCVDAAYYAFPARKSLEQLASQVPPDFLFGFKVTDEITLKTFPRLERFGERAGQANRNFLNADLFVSSYLAPCETIQPQVGVLIFEFSRFHPPDYAHGRDFIAALDAFLGKLPGGWPYAVELRNRQWLHSEYFSCLARHHITHVYNSWDAMPPVSDQMSLADSRTNPGLVTARFLLKPGRSYEEAVKLFEPYDRIGEKDEAARQAGRSLIQEGTKAGADRRTFIYVNNRLEGSALETIATMVEPDLAP